MPRHTSAEIIAKYEYGLTKKQLELIKLICLPYKEIGNKLGLSQRAISMRITRIIAKLGVNNRATVVVKALRVGLITLDQLVYEDYDGKTTDLP